MAKSDNTSIRCDVDKLSFVMKKENLPSIQKVVDFLLEKYWWENKMASNIVFTKTTHESYDGSPISKYVADEYGQMPIHEPIKDYTFYENLGQSVKFDDAEDLIKEILASNIKSWQKPILHKMINKRFFDN